MRINDEQFQQFMGLGNPGDVRHGPDGELYQWTETVDGLGNIHGWWKRAKRGIKKGIRKAVPMVAKYATRFHPGAKYLRKGLRFARRNPRFRKFTKKWLPTVQKYAPYIPVYGTAVAAGLRTARPFLRRADYAGIDGIAEPHGLLQAGYPDPYSGYAAHPDMAGFSGLGHYGHAAPDESFGETAVDEAGTPYQWVEGIDGLGQPFGYWEPNDEVGCPSLAGFAGGPYAQDPGFDQQVGGELHRIEGLAEEESWDHPHMVDEFAGFGEEMGYEPGEPTTYADPGFNDDQYVEGYVDAPGPAPPLGAYVKATPEREPSFVEPNPAPEIWRSIW